MRVSLGAVVAVVAVLVSGACGKDTTAGPPATSFSRAPLTTSAPATTTVAPEAALVEWGAARFTPLVTRAGEGLVAVGTALQDTDLEKARADCGGLEGTADEIRALIPSPTRTVDANLRRAADGLQAFAQGCQGIDPAMSEADLQAWAANQDTVRAAVDAINDEVAQSQR